MSGRALTSSPGSLAVGVLEPAHRLLLGGFLAHDAGAWASCRCQHPSMRSMTHIHTYTPTVHPPDHEGRGGGGYSSCRHEPSQAPGRDEHRHTSGTYTHLSDKHKHSVKVEPSPCAHDLQVPMVKAARKRMERMAPNKSFAAFLIYYRTTRHIATFVIVMLVTYLIPVLGIKYVLLYHDMWYILACTLILSMVLHLFDVNRMPGLSSRVVVPWALLPLIAQDLYMLYHYLPRYIGACVAFLVSALSIFISLAFICLFFF